MMGYPRHGLQGVFRNFLMRTSVDEDLGRRSVYKGVSHGAAEHQDLKTGKIMKIEDLSGNAGNGHTPAEREPGEQSLDRKLRIKGKQRQVADELILDVELGAPGDQHERKNQPHAPGFEPDHERIQQRSRQAESHSECYGPEHAPPAQRLFPPLHALPGIEGGLLRFNLLNVRGKRGKGCAEAQGAGSGNGGCRERFVHSILGPSSKHEAIRNY